MNAICTIVAKNYFAYAATLMNSIKETNPDVEYYVLIADDIAENFDNRDINIINIRELEFSNLNELRYKYDVTEFCTAVKPRLLLYLFQKYHYDKVMYLDPDIWVFDKLDFIWDILDNHSLVVTPHIIQAEEQRELFHIQSEESILMSGIFNLGFVAFANTDEAMRIIKWWDKRLLVACYDDMNCGIFTDQKWMNFCLAFAESAYVLRHPGVNVAWWNYHEKEILIRNNKPIVLYQEKEYSMVFFHFSGYSPKNENEIGRHSIDISAQQEKEIKKIYKMYNELLMANGYETYSTSSYPYMYYDNGITITRLQRRMYRRLLEKGKSWDNPFSTKKGSYYELLKKNGLIVKEYNNNFNQNNKKTEKNMKYEKWLQVAFRMLKRIIGIKNYSYLIRYLNHCATDENQIFLLTKK